MSSDHIITGTVIEGEEYKHHDKFFRANGQLDPHGENGMLFAAEYILARHKLGKPAKLLEERIVHSIEEKLLPHSEPLSHDDTTATLCLSHFLGLDYHKRLSFRNWWTRYHPRDICYSFYMRGGIFSFLGLFVLWFTILCDIIDLITASIKLKQIKNGTRDSTNINLSMPAILWLRIETSNLRITRLLANIVLKLFGHSWYDMFKGYFGYPQHRDNHPTVQLMKELYV